MGEMMGECVLMQLGNEYHLKDLFTYWRNGVRRGIWVLDWPSNHYFFVKGVRIYQDLSGYVSPYNEHTVQNIPWGGTRAIPPHPQLTEIHNEAWLKLNMESISPPP